MNGWIKRHDRTTGGFHNYRLAQENIGILVVNKEVAYSRRYYQ